MKHATKLTVGIDVGSASVKVALVRSTDAPLTGTELLIGRSERIRRREAKDVVEGVYF